MTSSPTFDGAHQVALELSGVTKSFGGTRVVDDLSFSIPTGCTFSLLGPNGAGKSTTIDMCIGFTTPDAGHVKVLGRDVSRHAEDIRSRLGIMLQGGGGYSGAKVEELLRLTASYSAHPHDVDWLINSVGLDAQRKVSYRRLSGGQQQRLALALALVGRPEMVFLDEPTAGMDAQSRHLVWDLIAALKRDGVTVLLTTHFMEEAERLSDHIAIIDRGRLVASGTAADLIATHAAESSDAFARLNRPLDLREVRAHRPELADALAPLPDDPLTLSFGSRATPALIADLAAVLAERDIALVEFSHRHATLEDVFLSLTGRRLRGEE